MTFTINIKRSTTSLSFKYLSIKNKDNTSLYRYYSLNEFLSKSPS